MLAYIIFLNQSISGVHVVFVGKGPSCFTQGSLALMGQAINPQRLGLIPNLGLRLWPLAQVEA